MPTINFHDVTKDFAVKDGGFLALDHVGLDIEDGEFVTVVGPSGCGKSTLMNIAAGLLDATGGEVLVDGVPVSGPSPERGVIFQQYALFPWMTVAANVEYGLKVAGVKKEERRRRAREVIELVGLTDFADSLPKTLSGGMKQRCAIARAYAVDPKVLLMDEPFGALDSLTRVRMQESLLDTWGRDRRTVMFITHDVDEAVYLGTRIVVLSARPGRIVLDESSDLPRLDDPRADSAFTRRRELITEAVRAAAGVSA